MTEFEVPLPYPRLLTVEQETEKAMEHRGVMGNDGHLEVVSLPTPSCRPLLSVTKCVPATMPAQNGVQPVRPLHPGGSQAACYNPSITGTRA